METADVSLEVTSAKPPKNIRVRQDHMELVMSPHQARMLSKWILKLADLIEEEESETHDKP